MGFYDKVILPRLLDLAMRIAEAVLGVDMQAPEPVKQLHVGRARTRW